MFRENSLIRKFWMVILSAAWLLAGCVGGVSQPTIPSTPIVSVSQPTSTQPLVPSPTIEKSNTPTVVEATEDVNGPPIPTGCTVVSKRFSPEPTEQSLFPAVTETDWSLGSDTATVTIIEYGDFQ